MCLILDTNKYGDFLNPDNIDMQPIRKWLNGSGKIAYSPTETFEEELEKTKRMKTKFLEYRDAGKMKYFDEKEVQKKENKLSNLKSDDPHIIALAIVANVKLLVSGDKKLRDDFKHHPDIKGNIYQNKNHKKLLTPDLCP